MTIRAPSHRLAPLHRLGAAAGASGCLTVLVIGASLRPSENGHGTHEALGLPACGWAQAFDAPCATCGMTTAVTQASHGDFLGAFLTQPAGTLIALGAAAAFWICLHSALTGSRAVRTLAGLTTPRGLITIGVAVGLAWAYKAVTWA